MQGLKMIHSIHSRMNARNGPNVKWMLGKRGVSMMMVTLAMNICLQETQYLVPTKHSLPQTSWSYSPALRNSRLLSWQSLAIIGNYWQPLATLVVAEIWPIIEKKPLATQTTRLMLTLPVLARTPVGETKMPLPMMQPTITFTMQWWWGPRWWWWLRCIRWEESFLLWDQRPSRLLRQLQASHLCRWNGRQVSFHFASEALVMHPYSSSVFWPSYHFSVDKREKLW